MYRVVRASILYYEKNMQGAKSRYGLILPFMLLTRLERFKTSKKNSTPAYRNLCDIVHYMRKLYNSNEDKYHHFDMLLNELEVLGFDFSNTAQYNTPQDKLDSQISLLLQFLSYRYAFDAYDNKTGCHDLNTNQYIFIQP